MPGDTGETQPQPPQPSLAEAGLGPLGAEAGPPLRREAHELPDGRYLIAYWSGGNA